MISKTFLTKKEAPMDKRIIASATTQYTLHLSKTTTFQLY